MVAYLFHPKRWMAYPVLGICLHACNPSPCPPAEQVTVHDTIYQEPEPPSLTIPGSVVGYFDPDENVIYAQAAHEAPVLELFQARQVRPGFYKMVGLDVDGKTLSVGVALKIVPNPEEFDKPKKRMSGPLPAFVYANAKCHENNPGSETDCEQSKQDSSRYHKFKFMPWGLCTSGEGYCIAFKGIKQVVEEWYQDSDCRLLLDAKATAYVGLATCLPPKHE